MNPTHSHTCLTGGFLLRLSCLLLALAGGLTTLPAQQGAPSSFASPEEAETITIRADSQQKERDLYRLRGHVELTYLETKLTAEEVSYDDASGEVVARGNVGFTDPQAHLQAEEVRYNIRSGKGCFTNGRGWVRPKVQIRSGTPTSQSPYWISASQIERLDESTYVIRKGRMTTCECEKTGWSLGARRARVQVDDKVVVRDSVFRLLRVPVLYSPIFVTSIARRPRQTGFLLPHVGNSSQKGFIVGGGFFWAINRSADLLLGVENYSVRGVARSGRFRARPSATSEIDVEYSGVNDKGGGPLRQARAPGQSLRVVGEARDLALGFRGVIDVDYITSLAYRLAFTDNFTQAVVSEARQIGFVTRNFGAYSLNIHTSRYQNFLSAARAPGNSIKIWRTPGLWFSGMDSQIGRSPLYFSFETSAGGVGRAEPDFQTPNLSERLDVHPQVAFRTRGVWGVRVTPTAGFRATHYGTSLRADGEPLTRILGELSVDVRPPSLARVFSSSAWSHRFKHVIEPSIRYRLVRARKPTELMNIVRFDPVDILAETNEVEYSLTNTLFSRKENPESPAQKPQARELVSWRLSQKYYFDPTFGGALQPGGRAVLDPTISLSGFAFAQGRRLSPIVSVLKFSPFSNYDTELRADFNPSGGGVLNAGITSHIHHGSLGLSVTDFFINRTAGLSTPIAPGTSASQLVSFNLLRAVATYGDVHRKGLSAAFGVDYNFSQGLAHQWLSQVSYNFGCFAFDAEFRRFALGLFRREHQFRMGISLANVGSFGNLKPRERLY